MPDCGGVKKTCKPAPKGKCAHCIHQCVCKHAESAMLSTKDINERCTDPNLGGVYYEMRCENFGPDNVVNDCALAQM